MISASDWSELLAATASLPQTTWQSICLRIDAEAYLYEFVKQAWPHVEWAPFVDNWHIKAICDHLQEVSFGVIDNLLVNIPPGCSKSLITCIFWPVWEWIHRPHLRWFFASYDQRLSTRDSVRCRALIDSPWFQSNWGERFRLRYDQNQKTYYETNKGGYRLATTVNGHGTGEHPDRIVVDDPQDPAGVESEAERQSVLEWWDLTMSTRGVSRGVRRVIIMQRLSVDDLSGHVLKEPGWVHICLPMYYEPDRMPDTPLEWNDPRQAEGELLAPVQFPEEKLAPVKAKLTAYGVAGQFQQRPAPRGGALFKRDWWKGKCRYELQNGEALIRQGQPHVIPLNTLAVFIIVDGGASSKETADPTAMLVFGVADDGDVFVLHAQQQRLELEDVVPILDDLCLAWNPEWVGIEANGFQKWFVKVARDQQRFRAIPSVKELEPEGKGKAARAAPAIIRAEQGQIWLPYPDDYTNPWVSDFEEELYAFTGKEGRQDHRTDCLAYAVLAIDQLGYDSMTVDNMPCGVGRRPGPFQDW